MTSAQSLDSSGPMSLAKVRDEGTRRYSRAFAATHQPDLARILEGLPLLSKLNVLEMFMAPRGAVQ